LPDVIGKSGTVVGETLLSEISEPIVLTFLIYRLLFFLNLYQRQFSFNSCAAIPDAKKEKPGRNFCAKLGRFDTNLILK
jgi:hypothetical protein